MVTNYEPRLMQKISMNGCVSSAPRTIPYIERKYPAQHVESSFRALAGSAERVGLIEATHQSSFFGRRFGNRRPAELPEYVRGATGSRAGLILALLAIQSVAPEQVGMDRKTYRDFCLAFLRIIAHESRCEIGRPANTFNPSGGITAWGIAQFNGWAFPPETGYSKSYAHFGDREGCNLLDEIMFPFFKYAHTYKRTIRAGKDPVFGLWLRHSSGAKWRDYLQGKPTYRGETPESQLKKYMTGKNPLNKNSRGHNRLVLIVKAARRGEDWS